MLMKNEKLKEIIKHQKDIINNLEDKLLFQKLENYKLENRIKKAIEYLKENKDKPIYLDCKFYETKEYKDLLEILRGDK